MSTSSFSAAERKISIAAVMIVFLLSALDQTIVSTAMPRIVSELHGLELYSWVTTAYLLTSTVVVPIAGKLSDLIGRKPVLLTAILFFVIGSWLSGLSGEFDNIPVLGGGMTQLIVFRAIQGIGGGALFTTAFAIIGDLYPPRERAWMDGMFGAVFGLSSAIGPLIGGYFTDHGTITVAGHLIEGWRWVFYINLPLSLLSLFMVIVMMPKMSHEAKGKIDFIGAILIIGTVVPFLLALTYGGHTYSWLSPFVLGLFAASATGLLLYVVNERFASDPILPLELFRNRAFSSLNAAGFLVSMSFMSAIAFLPLFIQIGQNVGATASGLTMLPFLVGMMGGAMYCGRLVARHGKYKAIMVFGGALTFISIWLLSRMTIDTSRIGVAFRVFLFGLGLGPSQSVISIVIQSAVEPSELGVATSSVQFFRQIGSTVGVAIFGTLLTNGMNASLGKAMPGVDIAKLEGLTAAKSAGQVIPEFVRTIIADVITHTFTITLILVAASLIATFFIPDIPLRDRTSEMVDERLDEELAELAPTAPGTAHI